MTSAERPSFTSHHEIRSDGSVAFRCSTDAEAWPWLRLQAHHPVLVQSINYWASVESGRARGTFDPNKWSALTETEWQCDAPGPIVAGVSDPPGADGSPAYGLKFFNAEGATVCKMTGTGVVFRTRDFEAWRSKAKSVPVSDEAWNTEYVEAQNVGVATDSEAFLSSLTGDAVVSARGLITRENGLIPNHPYLDGSGDHVNSTHLAEVARQFACLVAKTPNISLPGGDMRFTRYVELGRPFEVVQTEPLRDNQLSLVVRQGGKDCTSVRLDLGHLSG